MARMERQPAKLRTLAFCANGMPKLARYALEPMPFSQGQFLPYGKQVELLADVVPALNAFFGEQAPARFARRDQVARLEREVAGAFGLEQVH